MAETMDDADDRESTGRRRIKLAVLGVVIVAVVVIGLRLRAGGDSGGFGPSSHERPDNSGGTYSAEQQEQFAQCLRDQGLDVRSDVDANGQFQMTPGPGVDPSGPAFQNALRQCQSMFAGGGGQSPHGGG